MFFCLGQSLIVSLPGVAVDIGHDANLLHTCHEIFYNSCYGELNLEASDVVLDCGANIGLFSMLVSPRVRSVVSVEALRDNYTMLVANVKRNGLPNIRPFHNAVYSSETILPLYGKSVGANLYRNIFSKHVEYVQTVTIDKLASSLNTRFTVLKIDVENAEVEALKGAEETLRHVKEVVIEFHSDSLKLECEQILERYGFKVTSVKPKKDMTWLKGYALLNYRQILMHCKPDCFRLRRQPKKTFENEALGVIHASSP